MVSEPARLDFDSISPGHSYSMRQTIDEKIIDNFAQLSGDFNPLHMDSGFAQTLGFPRRVAHGVILGGLLSKLIGMHLPGAGSLWINQEFQWPIPVFIGDTVDLTIKVVHKSNATRTLIVEAIAVNQKNEVVMKGKGSVMMMEPKNRSAALAQQVARIALVTGSARGIGAAVAASLAETGMPVAVNYVRNQSAAEEVCAAIQEKGGKAKVFRADISNEDEVQGMVSHIRSEWNLPIGVLVNNASGPIEEATFADLTWAMIQSYIDIQVKGAFNACKAVVSSMMDEKSGSIINIGSADSIGVPPPRWTGYLIAKHALRGLTRSLARELGPHGITVNMVSPGFTETDQTSSIPLRQKKVIEAQIPLRRLCSTRDVANTVAFLASPAAAFLNGVEIPVSGGQAIL